MDRHVQDAPLGQGPSISGRDPKKTKRLRNGIISILYCTIYSLKRP